VRTDDVPQTNDQDRRQRLVVGSLLFLQLLLRLLFELVKETEPPIHPDIQKVNPSRVRLYSMESFGRARIEGVRVCAEYALETS
jgi:hypothetical protein